MTNLQTLRPSRKKVRPGDIFAMLLPDGLYLFGRVIRDDAKWARGEDVNPALLIYVYRFRSQKKDTPPALELKSDRLLISPVMINRLPWSRGYFETIDNLQLGDEDILPVHCFLSANGKYYDEYSNLLPGPVEPVGDYGLASYRVVDDEVSDRLGISLAPD